MDRRQTPLTLVAPMPDFFIALASGAKYRSVAWLLRNVKNPCATLPRFLPAASRMHGPSLLPAVSLNRSLSLAATQATVEVTRSGTKSEARYGSTGTHDDGGDAHGCRCRGQRPSADWRRDLQRPSLAWCTLPLSCANNQPTTHTNVLLCHDDGPWWQLNIKLYCCIQPGVELCAVQVKALSLWWTTCWRG